MFTLFQINPVARGVVRALAELDLPAGKDPGRLPLPTPADQDAPAAGDYGHAISGPPACSSRRPFSPGPPRHVRYPPCRPSSPGSSCWAGQLRTVSAAKGSVFCLPQHLESYAADVFGQLAAVERLRGLARDPFITALAGSWLTSTPCTRSARATAAPSARSSPSSPMTLGITSPGCAWTLTATWPPALPPTTATWPGSGKCPEISAAG